MIDATPEQIVAFMTGGKMTDIVERLREALQGMLDDEPGAVQFAVRALEQKP